MREPRTNGWRKRIRATRRRRNRWLSGMAEQRSRGGAEILRDGVRGRQQRSADVFSSADVRARDESAGAQDRSAALARRFCSTDWRMPMRRAAISRKPGSRRRTGASGAARKTTRGRPATCSGIRMRARFTRENSWSARRELPKSVECEGSHAACRSSLRGNCGPQKPFPVTVE